MPLQANTYYFATTGNDSNPCSIAQPCKTVGAVNYSSGDTLLALDGVDFGAGNQLNFGGNITIDGGAHGAFYTFAATVGAYAINLVGNLNATIRNVTLVCNCGGGGIGIVLSGGSVTLENVTVVDLNGSATGIYATLAGGASLHLNRVTILGQGSGITASNSGGTTPFSLEAENVTVDVAGNGATVTDGNAVFRNSRFVNPAPSGTGVGFLVSKTTPSLLLDTCAFQGLAYGLVSEAGATVRISNSEFTGNNFGIFGSGAVISYRNNVFAGNGNDGSPMLSTSLK